MTTTLFMPIKLNIRAFLVVKFLTQSEYSGGLRG